MNLQSASQFAFLSVIPVFAAVVTFFYQQWKKHKVPSNWEQIGTLGELYLYPLKSGRRIELQEAECTLKGLRQVSTILSLMDRVLLVYGDKDKEFRTARTYPKMMNIQVSAYDENHFKLEAPGMPLLLVQVPNRREQKEVGLKYWRNERISGLDCGEEVAGWLSQYILGQDSGFRLAYNDELSRDIVKHRPDFVKINKNLDNDATGLFTDFTAILIINKASVDDLNERLEENISCKNFRPNIVIEGPKAFDEDHWDWIKIGDEVVLKFAKWCTRCIMININPDTTSRGKEPLKVLGDYRAIDKHENSPVMGVLFGVKNVGKIKIGDPIFIPKP